MAVSLPCWLYIIAIGLKNIYLRMAKVNNLYPKKYLIVSISLSRNDPQNYVQLNLTDDG